MRLIVEGHAGVFVAQTADALGPSTRLALIAMQKQSSIRPLTAISYLAWLWRWRRLLV